MRKVAFIAGWVIGLLFAGCFLSGCTDPTGATKALQQAGYKNIQITGYRPFKCDDDAFKTGFLATGPTGYMSTGTVCGGYLFKGKTIRLD